MDEESILKFLKENYFPVDGAATYPGTYTTIDQNSLTAKMVSNRAAKGWPKAQYIMAPGSKGFVSKEKCLEGWKAVSKEGQILFLEDKIDGWEMYNGGTGECKGDDSFIKSFIRSNSYLKDISVASKNNISLIPALRTKPFLLLAGISGTGKSRIVRELAFKSCPIYLRDTEGTTPGNYLMVEVKPNWHDSTELLGYWSNLTGKYMFTKFVKFLVMAKMFPDVPFFVCLDEMNLAPVEQYFAEFLSVLETRTRTEDGVSTGILVGKEWFMTLALLSNTKDENGRPAFNLKNDREIYMKLYGIDTEHDIKEDVGNKTTLISKGLSLPDNVFVIGTVNMDDTTHQFSRKVIDRAMTIEMNGGTLTNVFKGDADLTYCADGEELKLDCFKAKYISASEAVQHCETLVKNPEFREYVTSEESKDSLAGRLKAINDVLEDTPFKVSYRVMNELVIHLAVLLDEKAPQGEMDSDTFHSLVNTALDHILLMKILPRIEGDDEMFHLNSDNAKGVISLDNEEPSVLNKLYELAPEREKASAEKEGEQEESNEGDKKPAPEEEPTSRVKLREMIMRLHRQNFTRFWP